MLNRILAIAGLTVISSCSSVQSPHAAGAPDHSQTPITLQDLRYATYQGIEDHPVTLDAGVWQGEPFVQGGSSAPRVGLAEKLRWSGDLDADGADEVVVILWSSSGGSGTFDFIAVMKRDENDIVINAATAELGDRVKVQSAEIREDRVVFDVVQAGPGDAMCCPRQKVRRTFQLKGDALIELASEDLGRTD